MASMLRTTLRNGRLQLDKGLSTPVTLFARADLGPQQAFQTFDSAVLLFSGTVLRHSVGRMCLPEDSRYLSSRTTEKRATSV